MDTINKFSSNNAHSFERLKRARSSLTHKEKVAEKPSKAPLVVIDSDYPSEEVLEVMRKMNTPRLKKITDSLF